MTGPRINPKALKMFHLILTIIWFILIVPSIIWWKESVPWLVLMSAWANFASHFSAWQGARSETNGDGNESSN